MSEKFIPNGDGDFAVKAESFARQIAAEPGRFAVSQKDSEALSAAVKAFREAFNVARSSARSRAVTEAKDVARARVVAIMRRLGNMIRANDAIDSTAKAMLDIRVRSGKVKPRPCPQEPPKLAFVRALHEGNGAMPMHELEFRSLKPFTGTKPPGAERLELFVDLVPPDEPIPTHPGANHGGRPWYLRSYTRSPIVLAPPMSRVPMRVVYWGRWADSTGNVGPFSATAVAWIEGGSNHLLPGGMQMLPPGAKPVAMMEVASAPAHRETTYRVAVIEAQYQSFHAHPIVEAAPQLPAPSPAHQTPRQLEGPAVSEAA